MRKCVLCDKEYEYCPNCPKDKSKATWYKLFCSENCKSIFNALNSFNFELISKEDAQALLKECDLSIELNEHYRSEIDAIMAKPKRGARARMNIIDEVIPDFRPEIIKEIEEEAVEEPVEVVITE